MTQMMKNNGLAGTRSPVGGDRIGRDSTFERAGTADAEVLDDRERVQRPVTKSLVIGAGGTGVAVISQLKRLLKSQRTPNFHKLLAIDTDANAQAGIDAGLSLTDEEFLHVSVDRIRTVIEHPKDHPELAERFDLGNPHVYAFQQQLITAGLQQGGQVRSHGNLALQANWGRLRAAIRSVLGELNNPLADIEKQLGTSDQLLIGEQTNVYFIASMAGGTGSSMILETLTLIRELTRDTRCHVVGILVTAGAFGKVLAGEPDQLVRVEANLYATVTEILATTSGQLQQLSGLQLGPGRRNSLEKTTDLWNEVYVVQSQDAGGHQYRAPREVSDRVALFLASIIGTEISNRFALTQANRATAQRITPDPRTGQVRQLGTISTTGLSLNAPRTADALASRLLSTVLQEQALGTTNHDTDLQIRSAFVLHPPGTQGISLTAESIAADLLRQLAVDPNRQSETLLKQRTKTRRVHESARRLLPKVRELLRRQESIVLPGCRTRCTDLGEGLKRKLQASVNQKLQSLITDGGLRMKLRFLEGIIEQLKRQADIAARQQEQAKQAMKQCHEQMQEICRQLDHSIRWWPMDGRRKDRIVDAAADYFRATYHHECFSVTTAMLTSLADELQRVARELMANGKRTADRIRLLREMTTTSASLVAGSHGELDVTTPAVELRLYRLLCPAPADAVQQIAAKLRMSKQELLQRITAETAVYERARELILAHFSRKLEEISITDVLAEQLDDPSGRHDAENRIRHVVTSCQPMWQAECGLLNQEFSDTLIIGVPRGTKPGAYDRICKQLMAAATRQINPNGQYRAVAQIVETTDRHRVYVIRNTVGACWYFLPEIVNAERSYEEWKQMGGHSVHIFNQATVEKFKSVIPREGQTD